MHPNEDFSDLRAREVVVAGAAVTGDLLATYGCSRKLWPAVTAWARRVHGYRVFAQCEERVARSDHVVVFLCMPCPVGRGVLAVRACQKRGTARYGMEKTMPSAYRVSGVGPMSARVSGELHRSRRSVACGDCLARCPGNGRSSCGVRSCFARVALW